MALDQDQRVPNALIKVGREYALYACTTRKKSGSLVEEAEVQYLTELS